MRVADIRIDGGTQPRAAINEDAVRDYAERLQHGVEFPPVVVFHDGKDHWLADGFHRWHAHQASGMGDIRAEVRTGTRRDAVLYAVGSNVAHGLQRTNADKRCAVTILLKDPEWSEWSDAEIARRCGVSHPTVASVRRELSPENFTGDAPSGDKQVTYTTKHGTKATMKPGKKSGNGASTKSNPPPAAPKPAPLAIVPNAEVEDLKERLGEMAAALQEAIDDNASMARVFEADDKVTAALAEAKRYREQLRIVESRITGLTNERNEAIRQAKMWQRRCERLEKSGANIAA